MPAYLFCIGSNEDCDRNLRLARTRLAERYPSVHFANPLVTEPINTSCPALFTNQVGRFVSHQGREEVNRYLKDIEQEAGRRPEDKATGKVILDIDLLMCDGEVLKPNDLERQYVRESIKQLIPTDMRFIGIIPARYASTRFPAKPLAILGGKTMIQHVYEQVVGILDDAYVATDDQRIEAAVKAFGGKVVMTSVNHQSGTDRCFEACTKVGGDFDVVVNIQGDEPFIRPSQLEAIKACFLDPTTQIATLVKPFPADETWETLENPNSPKVVVSQDMNALYFSRSVVPYLRNADKADWLEKHTFYKHIGLYAYRKEVLKEITSLPQSPLELAESLEQLRWIENGYTIKVGITQVETIGIDTPEDLQRAEEYLHKITHR